MTKAVLFPIPFILLAAVAASAQTAPSYGNTAVNHAVMVEADEIMLRQDLDAAKAAVAQRDLATAVDDYENAYKLVQDIGSGSIPEETSETVSGLVSVRMELAQEAERRGDLHEADVEVSRVLIVSPQDPEAIAFKRQNDALIAATRGTQPDMETKQEVPAIENQKTDAATLARDGQLLYEMGKLTEAEDKLEAALKLDPDNRGANYYLQLVKEARYVREQKKVITDNEDRMVEVEHAWEAPVNIVTNYSNPYFMTNLVFTGAGRETIYSKLNRIMIDHVNWQSLPLSEVIRQLQENSVQRDPDKQGINFIFNPNIENIPSPEEVAGLSGPGGVVGRPPTAINGVTGLPEEAPSAPQAADPTQINVTLQLNNVSLANLLDAICMVSDHPIKYSVEDWGIVFSQKSADAPQYESRTFKVDPNTFYAGLQNVSSFTFGAVTITSGQGGGSSGSSQGGQNGQSVSGAAVPVVNISPGEAQTRASTGGVGGGAAGATGTTGGGGAGGAGGLLTSALSDLNSRVQSPGGGVLYVTTPNLTRDVSGLAKEFFSSLGVNLNPPKALFFNDTSGELFVYATPQDLDIIEKAIQVLDEAPPEVQIKARFVDVLQTDTTGLGFDWYLGQFNIGSSVVGQGGNAGSVGVPVSSANPEGTFPGNSTLGTTIASTAQSLTSGLSTAEPSTSIATITGILTNPNFQMVINAIDQRSGTEELAEPQVTTLSGRQTQMRATVIQPVVTGFDFQSAPAAATAGVP